MEATTPHPNPLALPPLKEKIEPLFSGSLLQKTGSPYTSFPSKKFRTLSVMECQGATFHIKHMAMATLQKK